MRIVDADALKRKEQRLATQAWKMQVKASVETILNQFIDDIDHAPTVDAAPVVHGHWKEDPSGYGFWICSACGFVSEASAADMLYKFCPVCGAKMDGKDGNDENA